MKPILVPLSCSWRIRKPIRSLASASSAGVSRPVDQGADRVGLVGQRGQHVGGIEHAHDLALAPHDEVAHALARHQQGRLEQEAVLVDRRPRRSGRDRAPASRAAGARATAVRVRSTPVKMPMRSPSRTRSARWPARSMCTAASCRVVSGGDEDRRVQRRLADAGGQRTQRLRARLPLAQRLQLVRDVLEEEGGEGRVVGGELDEVLDRQGVADRLLAHDEVVPAWSGAPGSRCRSRRRSRARPRSRRRRAPRSGP